MTAVEKETIFDVFNDYYKNNKYADKNFICSILRVIMKENDYDRYIKKVRIYLKTIDEKMGAYSFYYKRMFFYMPTKNISVIDYNILMLRTILHECAHVEQYDYMMNEKDSVKKMLLKEDLGDQILDLYTSSVDLFHLPVSALKEIQKEKIYYDKKNLVYRILYEYSPSERMAEIESLLRTLIIVNKLEDERLDHKKDIIKRFCYEYMIRKYRKDGLVCPTYVWYEKLAEIAPEIERLKINPQIIEERSKNISFENRIYMGLAINEHEYKAVELKAKSL